MSDVGIGLIFYLRFNFISLESCTIIKLITSRTSFLWGLAPVNEIVL